ncbi:MAG: ABC transporter substrate-binding protein [Promethearchaeota archaeon]
MKKFSKILVSVLLLSSMILPFLPTIAKAQKEEEIKIFRYGVSAAGPDNWDPAISVGGVIFTHFFPIACEYPYGLNAAYDGGIGNKTREEEWKGILVTDWETTWRPVEENLYGFNNSGGRRVISFTLREGVKFHDGSDWNATVFKWNIDRLYLITGNLTGEGTGYSMSGYTSLWDSVDDWWMSQSKDYNISEYAAPTLDEDGVDGPSTPDPSWYAGYIIGKDTKYPGVTADENGVVRNPDPWGGWKGGSAIHYAMYDRYPIIKEVKITENKKSGGKIDVIFNRWNTYGGVGGLWTPQKISYAAYYKNYTGRGIYGYKNDEYGVGPSYIRHPKNPTIVDHCIGTGPYKYVSYSESATAMGGYMVKFEDYWNKTALEEDGWFDIDRLEIIRFPIGSVGLDALNTGVLTHAVDCAFDTFNTPIDYDAVMANKNIEYIEGYPTNYAILIALNCINESYWADPMLGYDSYRRASYSFYSDKEPCAGVPRALRKALNYAFDYDKMINTVLDGRAVRPGNIVYRGNIFYNASVPMADFNLNYARELLLTTEEDNYTKTPGAFNYNFSQRCAERGLTSASTDADWQQVAETDPIFVLNLYWDDSVEDIKNVFEEACKNIGVGFSEGVETGKNKVTGLVYDTLRYYWSDTFDGTHSIFSAHAYISYLYIPRTIPEGWIQAYYMTPRDPIYPAYNRVFCFDENITRWILEMFVSTSFHKYEMVSKMANKLCNELYPYIYAYQLKGGAVLWKDWETFLMNNRDGQPAFYYEVELPTFQLIKYVGLPEKPPLIPASPLIITLTISAVSMIGIIYAMMRKKKLS